MGFAMVVFRSESGDPVEIVWDSENLQSEDPTPAELGEVEVLWNIFGGTKYEKATKLWINALVWFAPISLIEIREALSKS
jgi:hypothetical protein